MHLRNLLFITLAMFPGRVLAQDSGWDQGYPVPGPGAVLSERSRADAINEMLADRLDNLLPDLMRETGLDMWLVINRDYAEDPVYLTLVPAPVYAARRTTMLVFFDRGEKLGVERLTVSRYGLGDSYESAWGGGSDDEQWARLAEVIAERDPKRIGVNTSDHWAFGDGLSSGLRARLDVALAGPLSSRVTSAEDLCIRWLETRTPKEMEVYPQLVHLARGVISEAFSNDVITPGVTTTDDVAWYLRQRFTDLGLPLWFQPYCNVQREGLTPADGSTIWGATQQTIHRGDVIHTDVGIHYLRLATDTQEMGYVPRPGESGVPDGLVAALAVGNQWQDDLTDAYVTGRSGNEILAAALAQCEAEGLEATIYSHPIGFHGHGAGPTIGLWDQQGGVPGKGDYPLYEMTAHSIELNAAVAIPEWDNQVVRIMLEEDAFFLQT